MKQGETSQSFESFIMCIVCDDVKNFVASRVIDDARPLCVVVAPCA
jgi:hypothetical protein